MKQQPIPADNGRPTRRERVALVLGATGGIGGEVARCLQVRGWRIRALNRNAAAAAEQGGEGIEWLQGDAMTREAVVGAARGADVIVHAVNPPGYRRWDEVVLPMLDNSIAAAKSAGARLLLPGTVYNFGPDAGAAPTEAAPQNPLTRKGAIRAEMERRLRAAAGQGVRSLVVRAGDYFGPGAANNWFSKGLVKPGRPVEAITNPGRAGVGHQWGYLPDVALTMVELLEQEERLDVADVFHMAGHWDHDGQQMAAAIARVAGRPAMKPRRFPWWLVSLLAPVVPLFRELAEMRYLWEKPLRMGNARLVALLGREPHTPLDDAVRATLEGLGCVPGTGRSDGDPVDAASPAAVARQPLPGLR